MASSLPADTVRVRLGLGTYRCGGRVKDAVKMSVAEGCQLIDTAPNYAGGQAQVQVGVALAEHDAGASVAVSTKVGFVDDRTRAAADGARVLRPDDVRGGHSLAPSYLAWQLHRSRDELGRDRIDVLYLHNPEHDRDRADRRRLLARIRVAFDACERLCDAGHIVGYGVATWSGFGTLNTPPAFTVRDLVMAARDVAGSAHHFTAVQLPVSLVNLHPVARALRHCDGVLADGARHGIRITVSAPLHGGQLARIATEDLAALIRRGLTPAQACLLVAASAPGIDTVLISTRSRRHWREAVETISSPPLSSVELRRITDVVDA